MAHLTLEQRYKIETYINLGTSISQTSEYIGKNKSVVCRELKRNRDQRSGKYRASLADKKAKDRIFAKPQKMRFDLEVEANVLYYLTYPPKQLHL